jgi:DNA polymerase III epsilon subunit family exonuclease
MGGKGRDVDWRTAKLIAIDSETTGIEPGTDRIVELGAYAMSGGANGIKLGSLVNSGRKIPEDATKVHGITDDDVRDAPTLAELAPRFLERVRDADVLVGYNFPYDAAMLEAELGDAWRNAIDGKPILDALVVVRTDAVGRWWKGSGRHKLDAVADRLGLERSGESHRASSDARLALQVLYACQRHFPHDASDAHRYLARERERQDADYERWLARQPKREATG